MTRLLAYPDSGAALGTTFNIKQLKLLSETHLSAKLCVSLLVRKQHNTWSTKVWSSVEMDKVSYSSGVLWPIYWTSPCLLSLTPSLSEHKWEPQNLTYEFRSLSSMNTQVHFISSHSVSLPGQPLFTKHWYDSSSYFRFFSSTQYPFISHNAASK